MRERERNKERKDGMNEYLRNKKTSESLGSNQIKLARTASPLVNFLFLYLLYFLTE
jgi:hypothetical protein